MEIDKFTVAFPLWKRWQFVHIVSNPSGLFCQPSARLYPHAPPASFLQVLILKGRKSIRLPLARASRRRWLPRQRRKAQPRAPWALGKAGRRLLESKLPKEAVDMILVR